MKKFIKFIVIALIIILFSSTVIASSDSYEVHFLDTGQSDCILIKGNNHNYLIDTGAAYYTDKILKYLDHHHVSKIDKIIITHYHDDHYGGLYKILAQKKVDKVMLPMHENKHKYEFYRDIVKQGIEVEYINKNWQLKDGRINLKAIAPMKQDLNNENNNSIVLLAQVDRIKYLFCADCEKEEEKDIINNNEVENCDLIKIPHHALNTSSTVQFLQFANPKYAVVTSNGVDTPDHEIIKRIENNNIKVYRTDKFGNVVIKNGNIEFTNSKDKVKLK